MGCLPTRYVLTVQVQRKEDPKSKSGSENSRAHMALVPAAEQAAAEGGRTAEWSEPWAGRAEAPFPGTEVLGFFEPERPQPHQEGDHLL